MAKMRLLKIAIKKLCYKLNKLRCRTLTNNGNANFSSTLQPSQQEFLSRNCISTRLLIITRETRVMYYRSFKVNNVYEISLNQTEQSTLKNITSSNHTKTRTTYNFI
jgi:hypothetical protein